MVCPPAYLEGADGDHIITALWTHTPIGFSNRDAITDMCGGKLLVVCFGFDSASSNILLMKWIVNVAWHHGLLCFTVHPEPCQMHPVRIVKASAIEAGGIASISYSVSKLARLHSSLTALQYSVALQVRAGMVVRHRVVLPGDGPFLKMAIDILQNNAESSLLFTTGKHTKQKHPSQPHKDLTWLDQHCRYEGSHWV